MKYLILFFIWCFISLITFATLILIFFNNPIMIQILPILTLHFFMGATIILVYGGFEVLSDARKTIRMINDYEKRRKKC